MIEVFEIDFDRATGVARALNVDIAAEDRFFLMHEGTDVGLGVLSLEKGAVLIKHIALASGYGFEYFDLLARSLLGVVRDFSPIKVITRLSKDYFARLGFKEVNDCMQAMNTEICLVCRR